jgi:predicted ATP-binding protein involved in virulence
VKDPNQVQNGRPGGTNSPSKFFRADFDKRRSEQGKLRGGESEMTRLKELWSEPSFANSRDYWRERLFSRRAQSTLREEIFKEFSIKLVHDYQITRFRQWVEGHDERDEMEEQMEEDCRRIERMFPKATENEIRRIVFKAYHLRALARDDVELGKFILRQSLAERKLALSEKKASEAGRSDKLKALGLCLDETSDYPAARQLFRAAFAELRKQKAKASVSPQDQSEKTMTNNYDGPPQAASGNDG